MKDTNIGLPVKRIIEVPLPEEEWPVPTFLPMDEPAEEEPAGAPDKEPALVP